MERESNYDRQCHADVQRNHKEELKKQRNKKMGKKRIKDIKTKKPTKEKKRNNKVAICPINKLIEFLEKESNCDRLRNHKEGIKSSNGESSKKRKMFVY